MCNISVYIYIYIYTFQLVHYTARIQTSEIYIFSYSSYHIVSIYIRIYMYCLYICIEFQVFVVWHYQIFQCFPTLRFAAVDRSFLRVAWPCARGHDESNGSSIAEPRVARKRGWKGLQCVPCFQGKAKGRTSAEISEETFQKSMMTSMLILYKKPGFKNGNGAY